MNQKKYLFKLGGESGHSSLSLPSISSFMHAEFPI